jgi:malate permease and related proteins
VTLLLSILVSDILPIFVIAGIGFLIEWRSAGSVKTLSAVSFNALSPCLIFDQLVTSKVGGSDVGRMALYCILLTATMGITARLAAIPLRLDPKTRSSFLLVVMFSNSGNYALPVILFAFGREALAHASIYFVTSAIVVYTAGVFIAATSGRSVRQALLGFFRVPALYALAAAAVILLTHIEPPAVVMRPIGMLSDAALPIMVLVLGMQLRRAALPSRPAVVTLAVVLSLLIAPIIGFALTLLLGLSGVARDAAIVVAAMPSAVITTVLALEFDLDSNFVTSVVFVSTLLSPLTLVLLLAYLQYS